MLSIANFAEIATDSVIDPHYFPNTLATGSATSFQENQYWSSQPAGEYFASDLEYLSARLRRNSFRSDPAHLDETNLGVRLVRGGL